MEIELLKKKFVYPYEELQPLESFTNHSNWEKEITLPL